MAGYSCYTKHRDCSRLLQSLCALCLMASLLACGMPSDRFRLEGRFRNMNQGEFYLCNLRNGTRDTLRVADGRFSFETELTDTTVYVLLFPNFSELPVIAHPGCLVKMEGDVSHLKEIVVKGSEENELMTAFRTETKELTPPEVQAQAADFIARHPTTQASVYLLRRHFIQPVTPDYPRAYELCSALLEAQPTSVELVQLKQQLERVKNMTAEGRLPRFAAVDTKGRAVGDSLLNKKVNLVLTWSIWSFDSQNIIRQMKALSDEHPRDMAVVTVALNASQSEGRNIFARDSLKWPDICDGLMWDSPVVTQLGLAFVPDNIVVDGEGKIIARSLNGADLRAKVKELLEQ